jgi:hypothetical protein
LLTDPRQFTQHGFENPPEVDLADHEDGKRPVSVEPRSYRRTG